MQRKKSQISLLRIDSTSNIKQYHDMIKIVFVRHGQSAWNLENRFTGWTDVDLSPKGITESHEVAEVLKREGYTFDLAFTSLLKRAIRTLWIILDDMDLMWVEVIRSWRLNERHYGALQGLNKKETADKFGYEVVHRWRRSYDIPPPALEPFDPRHPCNDRRYADVPQELLPATECLKTTLERVLPYWNEAIVPRLKQGKKIIVAAHGNSLRAIVKYLDSMSEQDIMELNIPTGVPLVYEFDDQLKAKNHYYLGDPEKIKQASAAVANQLKGK
jgi:2,3-bisphosphoglycerate-dependent phosphoglycerate mutase